MPLAEFIEELFTSGHLSVHLTDAPSIDDAAKSRLAGWERVWRDHVPGTAPEFNLEVGMWAVKWLYQVCQFTLWRDASPELIEQALESPCPLPRSDVTDYSADVCFRFLPDVLRLATKLSPADYLVERIRVEAAAWPLSSVGIQNLPQLAPLDSFLSNPSLKQLYVDRILATEDRSRIDHPVVLNAIKTAIGAHPNLCPWLDISA